MIYKRFLKCLLVPLVELGACRTRVSDSPFRPRNPRHLSSRPRIFLRILENGEIPFWLLIRTFFCHYCLMVSVFVETETLGANRFVLTSRYLNPKGKSNGHTLPKKRKKDNLTVNVDYRQL